MICFFSSFFFLLIVGSTSKRVQAQPLHRFASCGSIAESGRGFGAVAELGSITNVGCCDGGVGSDGV